ncbi:hypothetical protein EST38_g8213 [Candolleomyces aberdarensis]|uniref:Cell morphogenesis protein n=1 Tax=Candolleomyces aberdarensis TaxID=2316362 RepID=A0A4Q2DF76_9AGAR|nr:hypothetical protein EST38_g8213 [Candolleomyces aberdarensis]
MSEGIQITIPDFGDDDVRSAPTPFGRSGFGFGGFGSDSPGGTTTPVVGFGERSFFHHSRGDSSASIDSANSATTRFTAKPPTPFGHSSQSSIATGNTGFTKKPSFASIRNAFKTGKITNNDAPPVPHLEQAYPVLKNPFNRSTSSLHQHAPSPTPRSNGFMQRPSTSGSTDARFGKSKSKGHIPAKSQHSHTGSIFNMSDTGSDYGHGYFSPPPVPRVPGAYRSETPPQDYFDDDKVVMDPKTPSDYALHAIFIRFASQAEGKIELYLRQPLEPELPFEQSLGPGVDPNFDDTLNSLAIIAQKKAKPVIDSVMRWRRTQNDSDNSVAGERKAMASIYIMCRALVCVLQHMSKDALGDAFGYTIEESFFEQFRRPDSRHQSSLNHRSNTELYASLLGQLARVRFVTVTDRFLAELGPVTLGQIAKDQDNKFENLVRGMRYIQIKVWPPEAFEEGAEFMESLSKTYVNTHGQRLKVAFAETLLSLLHPIGKTAQAETNIPQWAKAIEMIYPKARETMSKPRYWQVAYPLAITSLCVGPQTYFLKHWQACFDSMISKLKDKPSRLPVMNGMMRLMWTYLYRCQETPSTTMGKLETMLKHFLPPNRLTVIPGDETLDFLTYIAHFILSRHFEYGKDFCLELMQEPTITSLQKTTGNIASALAPERTAIAVNAILLTLSMLEREQPTPSWPSSSDYYVPVPREDYPTSSAYLPQTLLAKNAIKDLLDRCGSTLAVITNYCAGLVGNMSVFDEQWSAARLNVGYEERDNFIIRRHPSGVTVAYPSHSAPYISLLATCFQSWPRCMHGSSILVADAVDLLLRGVVHVDLVLSETALAALKRFMDDSNNALTVVARFTSFLFSPQRIMQQEMMSGVAGHKLYVEAGFLVELWVEIVETWLRKMMDMPQEKFEEEKDIVLSKCDDIEAAGLFLLSHELTTAHAAGIRVVRLLGLLANHIQTLKISISPGHLYFVNQLHGKAEDMLFLTGFDNILDRSQLTRLEQWRQLKKEGMLLRIADSNADKDPQLWRYIFPLFLKACMDQPDGTLGLFREIIIAAVTRYHPIISHLAGLSTRVPAALAGPRSASDGGRPHRDNRHLVDQWHMWVKILCSTAFTPALGREQHNRAPSDVNFERERLSTSRGLFHYLTPFLDSEHTSFRDAAVQCISSFPANVYPQLLEDLNLLAGRRVYDDPRSKGSAPHMLSENPQFRMPGMGTNAQQLERIRRQERLHSAVARIYCLTAHYLQHKGLTGRQAALANVLKFVRNTQTFLSSPESKENPSLQRLRRYFCGTVERLFDGLASLEGSDRFIPKHMHLSLYRLCEEWCQVGPQSETARRRMEGMIRTASTLAESQEEVAEAVDKFKGEASMLSHAAIGALTSLCQKAYFPSEAGPPATGSPTERQSPELTKPLTALQVLDRMTAILASSQKNFQAKAKKGLRSLLTHTKMDPELPGETLRRAAVVSDKMDTVNERLFEVVVEVLCEGTRRFTFEQTVCLGLTNLRHPSVKIRSMAFDLLETIHQQSSGLLTMSNFEASVASNAPGTYIHAHRLVSDFLAGEHPEQATKMLVRLGYWLPSLPAETSDTNTILLLLQSLEFWIPNINLMTDDRTQLSSDGLNCLYHLMSMSLRYSSSHSEQILILWTKLVESPHQSNGHATVRFLLEQCHKVGNTIYIACAANIVACLCQTPVGREIYEELCSVIEPVRMLPVIDHKLAFPEAEDMELWEELDALFAEQPRLTLGSAQFAWLFLSDVSLQRHWEMKAQLPVLLHVIFTHLDHRVPFVRLRARSMVFQLLRAWTPGYDELPQPPQEKKKRGVVKERIAILEKEIEEYYWKEDDTSEEVEPKMKWLCQKVIEFLDPLLPSLASHWGSLALEWGTSCSIRATAFRSLQIFRALMPRVKKADFALLLGRLSNTVSSADPNIQHFTSEIFSTLHAVIDAQDKDKVLFPQVFWCIAACLSTTVESEFSQCLDLLQTLLMKMDLDDPATAESLHSQMPLEWKGPQCLQPTLLKGLRSSVTATKTMNILQILAKIQDTHFIDPSEGRLRDLYTVSLPWCLHAMDKGDSSLSSFAERLAQLASQEGKTSIQRIMTSFSKSAFRTKDDFLRQSVSTLREHYGARHWTDIVTQLLGLVLNAERWLRIHAMQVVKVLFQHRETRNPVELLGSELLMPLLRLLETDLAPQALEVLEEPISMFGGPAAKHVLRMSMQIPNILKTADADSVTIVFGAPEKSGWSIAQADALREACRGNVMAVFDTCSVPTRPSRIDFEPEVEALASIKTPTANDPYARNFQNLGGIFQGNGLEHQTPTRAPAVVPIPTRRLEARVAAILAKSTAPDIPQTPFIDVFRIGGVGDGDGEMHNLSHTHTNEYDSDEDGGGGGSDSDSDADSFIFDSVAAPRRQAVVNGYH